MTVRGLQIDGYGVCLPSTTVTFGAGQHEAHTIDEWIEIPAFQDACRVAIAAATAR